MRLLKYLVQYRFRDMGELIRNDRQDPLPTQADLAGKTVVITGATSGIGLATVRLFASRGARLVCINRDPVKSKALEEELKASFGCQIRSILADFSRLEEVRLAAGQLLAHPDPLDIIIHNTGVYHTKKTMSPDGIELVFQVNHLGAFLINHMLLPRLKAENRARILYVNSEGHRFALAGVHLKDLDWRWHWYSGLKGYGAAKTAQLLSMARFADEFSGTRVTINSMHPGNVDTNMGNNNGRLYRSIKKKFISPLARDPGVSARALLYLGADPGMEGVTGKFFNLTHEERPAPHARDRSQVAPVWNRSLELCGLS